MNLIYVTATEWTEFEQQFPRAEAFLRGKNLHGELRYLRWRKDPLTVTEAFRLAELEVWECWDRREFNCPTKVAAYNEARRAMKEELECRAK